MSTFSMGGHDGIDRMASGTFMDLLKKMHKITEKKEDAVLRFCAFVVEHEFEVEDNDKYTVVVLGDATHHLAQKACEAKKQEKLEEEVRWLRQCIEEVVELCRGDEYDLDVRVKIQELLESV